MNKFSNRAIKGMCKMGDIYLPQNGDFPKYSAVAGTHRLNDLIENAPKEDIEALGLVLAICSFLPHFVLKWIVSMLVKSATDTSDGVVASNLRQLNMGLRGLIFSTYYSELTNPNYTGKTPLEVIDYSINRVED
jgi:hypothetical protein